MDLKRNINDEIREKEALGRTAEELRNSIKRSEGDKMELNRRLQESQQRNGGQFYSQIPLQTYVKEFVPCLINQLTCVQTQELQVLNFTYVHKFIWMCIEN